MTALEIATLAKTNGFWHANEVHNQYRRSLGKPIGGDPNWDALYRAAKEVIGAGVMTLTQMNAVCEDPVKMDAIIYRLQQDTL